MYSQKSTDLELAAASTAVMILNLFLAFCILLLRYSRSSSSPCKLQNIAVVIDSTRLSDESVFEILTRHLPTYFFTDLKRFTGTDTQVSAVVYHQNLNCNLNRTLKNDEAVPPTPGMQVVKELRKLKHRKSTHAFSMACAKTNLFKQYEQFSVADGQGVTGVIFYATTNGIHVDVYYNKKFDADETLIFTDRFVHDNIALVLPSTKGINQSHFRRDIVETERKLDMMKSVLGTKFQMSALVYHDNRDCHRSRKWTQRDYFAPTQGDAAIRQKLRRLKHFVSPHVFDMGCAEKLLFSQYQTFRSRNEGMTGMVYLENDDLFLYHNNVKMMEIGFKFVDSWFRLVCEAMDQKSLAVRNCGGTAVKVVVVVVLMWWFVVILP